MLYHAGGSAYLGEISTLRLVKILSTDCYPDKRTVVINGSKYFDEPSISQKLQTLKDHFGIQYGDQNFHFELETVKM